MFVTDTLGNPHDDESWIPGILAPIAKSRREANHIKREEPITVVIGNPPYKDKAKGYGGWIESGDANAKERAPLADWMPPREWRVGVFSRHLRNLYIYFWRWATWKVYDHGPGNKSGIVCFITVAGFLNGLGFQKMRDYLRRTCDDIWVIDCSPEGYQPDVNSRIFQGVQQTVCIVLASRSAKTKGVRANVLFQALPSGHREEKFKALAALTISGKGWDECPSDWRAPFLPASPRAWATYPKLEDLFAYNGSGVMIGRTWIVAPDAESLRLRWQSLIDAPAEEKEALFYPHLRKGQPGDKHSNRIVPNALPGYERRPRTVAEERGPILPPARYGFRSFDRQWIIPDNRLINQPNAALWEVRSDSQVYVTAFTEESPTNGPALTFTGLIPDVHHYKGSFGGRVFPLWSDQKASIPNLPPKLLGILGEKFGNEVAAEDFIAYIAAIAAHPAFTVRFQEDLSTPGLRIPLTSARDTFAEAAELGRTIIWLHTFGERMANPQKGRPGQPPRLPPEKMPRIPAAGAIPQEPAAMPDSINYDASKRRLMVGQGYVENVESTTWRYEVSGKQVLLQWFSYRKVNRARPIIGDRRAPSKLSDIQPDHWLAEYTTELINVLNVLGLLVDIEPTQAALLEKVCSGPTISAEELQASGAFQAPNQPKRGAAKPLGPGLFESLDGGHMDPR